MTNRHVLIVGASGVIGTAAVEHFGSAPEWTVTALSRRAPIVSSSARHKHISVDLADAQNCAEAIKLLPAVSHLIYAAAKEADGLVTGWSDLELIADNARMFENVLDPLAKCETLRHAVVLQGTKAYGAHRHAVKVPCREDTPRDNHPNFYWLHEDHARRVGAEHGFSVTFLRPQVVFGDAPGAAMNPVLAIGAYSALCHAMGLPFAYPGAQDAMMEITDARMLAEAFAWVFNNSATADQIYNLTNGDIFVPADTWAEIATTLGHRSVAPTPLRFADFFARPETVAAWSALARRHGLLIDSLPAFLGQSHYYADLLLSSRIAKKSVPVLLSTIKIRRAGFTGFYDSRDSLLDALESMTRLRILPPLPGSPTH